MVSAHAGLCRKPARHAVRCASITAIFRDAWLGARRAGGLGPVAGRQGINLAALSGGRDDARCPFDLRQDVAMPGLHKGATARGRCGSGIVRGSMQSR